MAQNTDRNTVRVTIYNQPYTLAVSGEPAEVEELAHTVDDLMARISRQSGSADANRVAVMACLHLADQLRSLERTVGSKSREFSLLLDEALK